jgi:PiT family inorganic phosphate transporter
MFYILILPSILIGWSLGSNNFASVFPGVAQKVVNYKVAIIVGAIFVVLGAWLGGAAGMHTLSSITNQSLMSASVLIISAAIVVIFMSKFGIPASVSQAVLGGILGIGIYNHDVNFAPLLKVLVIWAINPIVAIFVAMLLEFILGYFFKKIKSISLRSKVIKIGAIVIGGYGAYALGANNVANVTGAVATPIFHDNYSLAGLVGGLAIALGVLTYSRKVMRTVGRDIAVLSSFGSVIAVLAMSINVWIFSLLGAPVSASQAIVGAVIGVGFLKGVSLINKKTILKIVTGWVATPLVAGLITFVAYFSINLAISYFC